MKANGTRCTAPGKHFENYCGTHYNSIRARDPAYVERERAHAAAQEQVRQDRVQARADGVAADRQARAEAEARRRAAEEARRLVEQATRRAEKIAKRDRQIADVPNMGPRQIVDHAVKALQIWDANNIPGYAIPNAYEALCYRSSRHEGFLPLMTAIVKLRFQAFQNHPDHPNYRDVPQAERTEVLTEIDTALTAYNDFDLLRRIPVDDAAARGFITARQERERLAALRREAERLAALAAEAEAVRRAEFNAQLREAPVVFQRDPENGINLRAFATDTQSVHRSSVQNSTHKAVVALLARPFPDGIETLVEIVETFNDRRTIRWFGPDNGSATKEVAVTEITNDYYNTEAFSVRYGDVVDRVWAFIRGHDHRTQLCIRLAQEIYEGRGMCSNGKMARLVNVLMGFDDTLETEAPKEVFQFRMAALRKRPMAEREAEARALFREFGIPEAEHDVWLEPLMEPDDDTAPAPATATTTA